MFIKAKLDEGAFPPESAHKADAGYDLRTPEAFLVYGCSKITVDTGVHIQIPEGLLASSRARADST